MLLAILLLFWANPEQANRVDGLLAAGRADEAIHYLETEGSKADEQTHHYLCRAFFMVRDWSAAVSNCEQALGINPASSRNHLWLGRAYGEKASDSNFLAAAPLARKAREQFEAAVAADPSNVEARADLAEFYTEAPGVVGGGRDKAARQASDLEALDLARSHWVRGMIAEKSKDLAAAEKEYRAAIESSKGAGLDWLNLGFFYKRAKRFDEMEEAFKKAVANENQRYEVKEEAADTMIKVDRNLAQAAVWLRDYVDGNKTAERAPVFKAYYWLGQAQEKSGNTSEAIASYKSALALARDYAPAREALNRLTHR